MPSQRPSRARQQAAPFLTDLRAERARLADEAAARQAAKDAEYREVLGVSPDEPLPATLGKCESNGRPLFFHRVQGERHAIGSSMKWGDT